MKELPIPFSAQEVRAVLDGRKTQTRRLMKPQPTEGWSHDGRLREIHKMRDGEFVMKNGEPVPIGYGYCNAWGDEGYACPFGQPGDQLWVREKFRLYSLSECECDGVCGCRQYDGKPLYYADGGYDNGKKWRPSIHMPRWASRILLEITGVRVERLQDISEADAIAEGSYLDRCECLPRSKDKTPVGVCFKQNFCHIHGEEYKHLFESLYGKDSWEENPWVWVVDFKLVKGE